MKSRDREQARRLSEYLDGLVLVRREADEASSPAPREEREFRELVELSRQLTGIDIRLPDGFDDDLARQLPVLALKEHEAQASSRVSFGSLCRGALARSRAALRALEPPVHGLRAAAVTAAALAAAIIIAWQVANTPPASAAEILDRADAALSHLVRPGEILYRRWEIVSRTLASPGSAWRIEESVAHEWMDGADFDHVASRVIAADGRLLYAYANDREKGELRSRLYFAPGFSNEARGLFNIEPTYRELVEAVDRLGEEERSIVRLYIDRGYIYEPIRGERRFNRAMLDTGLETDPRMPGVRVSLDTPEPSTGPPVYKVRVVHPMRIRARWRSEGPPIVRLVREETVRYVLKDSYLGLKMETQTQSEDGRLVITTQELVDTRVIASSTQGESPFHLEAPPGVPVRRQSAFEHLSEVAGALRRRRLERSTDSPHAPR